MKFHYESPQKLYGRAGVRICDSWICNLTCHQLCYRPWLDRLNWLFYWLILSCVPCEFPLNAFLTLNIGTHTWKFEQVHFYYWLKCLKISEWVVDNKDPDEMPYLAVSDPGSTLFAQAYLVINVACIAWQTQGSCCLSAVAAASSHFSFPFNNFWKDILIAFKFCRTLYHYKIQVKFNIGNHPPNFGWVMALFRLCVCCLFLLSNFWRDAWIHSNFPELYITIKYRSSSILVIISQILAELWPFFNLVFVGVLILVSDQ